jgi:amino acid adenylation domain-containing protein
MTHHQAESGFTPACNGRHSTLGQNPSPALQAHLQFWQDQLADFSFLETPLDNPRSLQTYAPAAEPFTLSTTLSSSLQKYGAQQESAILSLLLTTINLVLFRYTNQEDLLVAIPSQKVDHAVDQFTAVDPHLPKFRFLRTRIQPDLSFRELLNRVHIATVDALQHPTISAEEVLTLLPGPGSFQNLCRVAFGYYPSPLQELGLCAGASAPLELISADCTPDLFFAFGGGINGLEGSVIYNAHLFQAATIRRIIGHLSRLLEGIVTNPDIPASELPILSDSEEKQIVIDWNQTQLPFPRRASISELFEKQVKQSGDSIAIEHNDRRLTYRELNERANQLAWTLRRTGIQPGAFVAICMHRSIELVIGKLAILKAGAAYVPINPEYPAERRSLMLEGASLVLTTGEVVAMLARDPVRAIAVDSLDLSSAGIENLPSYSQGESVIAILYTSGSTGQSKGVAIAHRAVSALVLNTNYITFGPADVVAFLANICFDVALFEIWGPLLNGGRIVIVDYAVQLSPSTFVSEMKQRGVTILWITTSLFHLITHEIPTAFSGLRYVFIGGEILDPQSARRVLQHGPPENLVNVYGPTETTAFSTTYRIQSVPEGAKSIPIGKPIANTSVYILDRHRKPVPIGAIGEIYIGGAGIARSYLKRPELTAERFIADPFSTDAGARLYKTGDLARWLPDGSIDFIGRADFQVKIRGFRIELAEVEVALKRHPAIRAAVVEVRSNSEKDKQLAAYVASDPAKLTVREIREFLKTCLPDYMIPPIIVVLEKLPFNANGKIDRGALAKIPVMPGQKATVAPRNLLEKQLVSIWEEILEVEPVGINDDFFDIGGDSLLAIRTANRVQELTGRSVEAVILWEAPTIAELAELLCATGQMNGATAMRPGNGMVETLGSLAAPREMIKILPRIRQRLN